MSIQPIKIKKSDIEIDENNEIFATVSARSLGLDSDDNLRMFNAGKKWYLADESFSDPFVVELC